MASDVEDDETISVAGEDVPIVEHEEISEDAVPLLPATGIRGSRVYWIAFVVGYALAGASGLLYMAGALSFLLLAEPPAIVMLLFSSVEEIGSTLPVLDWVTDPPIGATALVFGNLIGWVETVRRGGRALRCATSTELLATHVDGERIVLPVEELVRHGEVSVTELDDDVEGGEYGD